MKCAFFTEILVGVLVNIPQTDKRQEIRPYIRKLEEPVHRTNKNKTTLTNE
jgi:hypothetical protein